MKDFLDNEIMLEDTVVFAMKGTRSYCASLDSSEVIGFKEHRNEVIVNALSTNSTNRKNVGKFSKNVIDITALERNKVH